MKMETAEALVTVHPDCQVHKRGLTPAEVLVLHKMHFQNARGQVITNLTVTGSVDRHPAEERERLRLAYTGRLANKNAIDAIFPDPIPRLPESFAEVESGLSVKFPRAALPVPAVEDDGKARRKG